MVYAHQYGYWDQRSRRSWAFWGEPVAMLLLTLIVSIVWLNRSVRANSLGIENTLSNCVEAHWQAHLRGPCFSAGFNVNVI